MQDDANKKTLQKKEDKDSKPPAYGTEDHDGIDTVLNEFENDVEGNDGEGNDRGGESGAVDTSEKGGANQSGNSQSLMWDQNNCSSQQPPNPFKSKGDINSAWYRRLDMVQHDPNAPDESEPQSMMMDQQDQSGRGTYEFAEDSDDGAEQVLANALETTEAAQPEEEKMEDGGGRPEPKSSALADDAKSDKKAEAPLKPSESRKRARDHFERPEIEMDEIIKDNTKAEMEETSEALNNGPDLSIEGNFGSKVLASNGFKEIISAALLESDEVEAAPMEVIRSDIFSDEDGRLENARTLWLLHRQRTETHATRLCEQLRLILEPTLTSRLQGDYRSGKRISMRKVLLNRISS